MSLVWLNVLFSIDLHWPSDEHHEFWMFCTTGRTEEEMGRPCAHITSMSPCVSCACLLAGHLYDLLTEMLLTMSSGVVS